ncbi:hypothetical protein JD844_003970 [Phrynosoma platyrhinos]|uniref:Uncharacterized protein n=1 Tax=Phrynosoma platyrhinos TaxID=52577 RepID=A0ABQ7TLU8_PHRPL|nr:hypothetical protein JD844_003970 [Phrynosoma platyrhinos]
MRLNSEGTAESAAVGKSLVHWMNQSWVLRANKNQR